MKTFIMTTDVKSVAEKEPRYKTNNVILASGGIDVYAYSTDARIAAIAKYHALDPTDGTVECVPSEVLPAGTAKGTRVKVGNGEASSGGRTLKYDQDVSHPPYAFGDAKVMGGIEPPKKVLSISVDNLYRLAKAICSKGDNKSLVVSIMLPDDDIDKGPLMVVADNGIGLVMPCVSDHISECVERFNSVKDAANAAIEGGSETE